VKEGGQARDFFGETRYFFRPNGLFKRKFLGLKISRLKIRLLLQSFFQNHSF